MIGVDWGTTSFRAYRMADDGTIQDRRTAALGIMQVENGAFADALAAQIGPWLADGERNVLMCGMIGSRQGWVEAPYLPCPAGAGEIAGALAGVAFPDADVRIVPGLIHADTAGVPDVMRGEETQLVGALPAIGTEGLVCLPGTHAKWVRIVRGRIAGFSTFMTGEVFSALRGHTILGRMMAEAPQDDAAFADGLARSAAPGGMLHHLFGVRALGLSGRLADTASASYLSGLLIGHEVRAAMPSAARVHLIGTAALTAPYAAAITACGGSPVVQSEAAAAAGLARIAGSASWT